MARHKKHTYKYLTTGMKLILDANIKERGKEQVYDEVFYNYFVSEVQKYQNEPYAFDVVERTDKGEPIYRWQKLWETTPVIWGGDEMPLEQEILFYVDGTRFYDTTKWKSISDICIDKLMRELQLR